MKPSSFILHLSSFLLLLPVLLHAAPPPRSYAINFAGRIGLPPANITSTFGPDGAKQDHWNNLVAPHRVNSNRTCTFDAQITDSSQANPLTLHIIDRGVDGGNDGGGGPATNDFQRLFNSGIRDGSSSWTITTDSPPFNSPYDVYIYSNGHGRSFGVNTGSTTTWSSATPSEPDHFEAGKNYRVFSGLTGPLHIHFSDAIEGFSIVDPAAYLDPDASPKFASIPFENIDGLPLSLQKYSGSPILIVNLASKSGFTPQYKGLQALYQKYQPSGLVILGFPSNDFGAQEPASNPEIKAFATSQFATTFPLMAKIHLKGPDQHPLYSELTGPDSPFPGDVKWNFAKFLIGRNGKIIARYPPATPPQDPTLLKAIEAELAKPTPPKSPPP